MDDRVRKVGVAHDIGQRTDAIERQTFPTAGLRFEIDVSIEVPQRSVVAHDKNGAGRRRLTTRRGAAVARGLRCAARAWD